jgi:hypothetical protein
LTCGFIDLDCSKESDNPSEAFCISFISVTESLNHANQLSESKSTEKKIIGIVWFWILIGRVIVGRLFLIMLSVGIDYGIQHYLKNQGADAVG